MIYDITPFTSLDYEHHLSAIVWFCGCNMRCQYCYNPQIVHAKDAKFSTDEVADFLRSRTGLLNGVVFSGGECSLAGELIQLCELAKSLNYDVKVDSNGSNPAVIKTLLERDLVDFFAIDFKAPADKFQAICGVDFSEQFFTTLDILLAHQADFEVRTTWHFDLLSYDDILHMESSLRERGYNRPYALQGFLPSENLGDLQAPQHCIDMSEFAAKSDRFVLRNFH